MIQRAFFLLACCSLAACSVLPPSSDEAGCTLRTVRITGVEVKPLDRQVRANGHIDYFYSSTLREQVVFAVEATHETLSEESVECPDDPLIDVAPGRVVNPIEGFGHIVQFDRSIQAAGAAIPAETNLLQVEALDDDYGLRTRPSPFAIAEVRFDRATFSFPPDDYRATFAWITSEGDVLQDRVDVRIDLK